MNKEKKSEKVRTRDVSGRYVSGYDPKYDAMLLEHLSQGYSFGSFAAVISVNQDTLFSWVKAHPSFREAKEVGTQKSLLVWEKMGMGGVLGKIKNFNTSTWIFNMKNRFGWRDRQEIKNLGQDDEFSEVITHDRIMAYIDGKKF